MISLDYLVSHFNLSILANKTLSVSLGLEIVNVLGAERTCFDHVLYKPFQKPPKPATQNRPSKYKPPGACTWKIALKYKVKQSKNGKFTSKYKASQIDFET